MDCAQCHGYCCKKAQVNVNVIDVAKILHVLGEYEFFHPNPRNKSFGIITSKGKDIIKIEEVLEYPHWHPEANLINPCHFLNEEGLCNIHDPLVSLESNLGRILIRMGLTLKAKPMICRQHPLFYDYFKNEVRKYNPCTQFIKSVKITDESVSSESNIVGDLQQALYDYYKITNNKYLMLELAQHLVTWKRKNPIKAFIKKLDKLRFSKGLCEERISDSYPNIYNIFLNPKSTTIKAHQ